MHKDLRKIWKPNRQKILTEWPFRCLPPIILCPIQPRWRQGPPQVFCSRRAWCEWGLRSPSSIQVDSTRAWQGACRRTDPPNLWHEDCPQNWASQFCPNSTKWSTISCNPIQTTLSRTCKTLKVNSLPTLSSSSLECLHEWKRPTNSCQKQTSQIRCNRRRCTRPRNSNSKMPILKPISVRWGLYKVACTTCGTLPGKSQTRSIPMSKLETTWTWAATSKNSKTCLPLSQSSPKLLLQSNASFQVHQTPISFSNSQKAINRSRLIVKWLNLDRMGLKCRSQWSSTILC